VLADGVTAVKSDEGNFPVPNIGQGMFAQPLFAVKVSADATNVVGVKVERVCSKSLPSCVERSNQ
jgi:hypothetical protein